MLPSSKPPDCLTFGNIDECQEWLLRREKELEGTRCVCKGQGPCSPEPHTHKLKHKLRNTETYTVSCDNHLQAYLGTSWFVEVPNSMVCSMCCTNEPMDGDGICEQCAIENGLVIAPGSTDAIRIREQGYCINRNVVHGCLVWTAPPDNMCEFCKNHFRMTGGGTPVGAHKHMQGPRIRVVATSARPCALTQSCAGTMVGNVRRYSAGLKPELVWVCDVCKKNQTAARTFAVPATPVVED